MKRPKAIESEIATARKPMRYFGVLLDHSDEEYVSLSGASRRHVPGAMPVRSDRSNISLFFSDAGLRPLNGFTSPDDYHLSLTASHTSNSLISRSAHCAFKCIFGWAQATAL
jgi:hypothetical protein